MRFAPLWTRALDGTERQLPADLPAERTLVLLAYRQRHQRDVDEWISLAVSLGVPATPRGSEGLMATAVIEVPFLSRAWRPARRFIDGGMAQGIGDPDVLARTLTAYGSPRRHRRACGLVAPEARDVDGRAEVEALVVERSGQVLWRASGRTPTSSPPGPSGLLDALRRPGPTPAD